MEKPNNKFTLSIPAIYFFNYLCLFIFFPSQSYAVTLEVGPGKTYTSVANAAVDAQSGDTILVFTGIYSGSNFISDLHGTEDNYIYILGELNGEVIFQGGSLGMQFSKVSYLHIENFKFTQHTGNSLNIDDGGAEEEERSHHINIVNCQFYDMGASGNNDFLKMSGVDDFVILGCSFLNGAAGGSGIDMVGCHEGIISGNTFENMGSNSIQAKGGTQFITISQNHFRNGGQRSLNLGGSTGLEFFRPLDATFEAADLDVYANIFIGSTAPIAYVGCVRVNVVNNTIINPGNWVIRILQETVDPERFEACGDNSFVNNLVYFDNSISTFVNIGPNTAPTTFTFSTNLWYNHTNPGNSTPSLPVVETNPVIGEDPLFENFDEEDLQLRSGSPAINAGTMTNFPVDYNGNNVPVGGFMDIGAFEFLGFLPVEFIGPQLIYKNHQVTILWSTQAEINNDYFSVERSRDGAEWISIRDVKGQGTNVQGKAYSVIDTEPFRGVNLYRVKQTDFDGTYTYSRTVSIHIQASKTVKIYPNPFIDHFRIEGDNLSERNLQLFNPSCVSVPIKIETIQGGVEVRVIGGGLSPGKYILMGDFGRLQLIKI